MLPFQPYLDRMDTQASLMRHLALIQGGYFVFTGVWPLLHFRSFEAVTGRKPEPWLVKMVGLLAASIGVALLFSAHGRRRPDRPARLLGTTSAASFAGIDLWYVSVGRISPVYLADAVVELGLLGGWLLARQPRRDATAG